MDLNIEVIEESVKGSTIFSIRITTTEKEFNYYGITENKEDAEALSEQIKAGNISPVHFNDVIHDFIIGKAYDKLIMNKI
ncbi:MAG: hypothetical protein IKL10_06570 [Clostridia bacterium]|nr:hypothetical protein [Clostridia bacterium]